MNPWQLLHFPSGASLRQVLREIKETSDPSQDVCARHGVALPVDLARIYLRDAERLELTPVIAEPDHWQSLLPRAGEGVWIMGAPGNGVAQTAAFLTSLQAMHSKSRKIIFSDFLSGGQPPSARATRAMTRGLIEEGSPYARAAETLYEKLQHAEGLWRKTVEMWRNGGANVVFDRGVPRSISGEDVLLTVSPKSRTVKKLGEVVDSVPCIVLDHTALSMADAISRSHLGMERMDPERSNQLRRQLLGGMACLVEQRRYPASEGSILVRRLCTLSKSDRADLRDESNPLKSVLAGCLASVPSWGVVTGQLIDSGGVPAKYHDDLIRTAGNWDSFSKKMLGQVQGPDIEERPAAGATAGL